MAFSRLMNLFNRSYLALSLILLTTPLSSTYAYDPESNPLFHLKAIIGDYPALGTPESDEDFRILLKYQETRTAADCAAAATEEKGNLKNLFGNLLTPNELKHFSNRMNRGTIAAGIDHLIAKMIYNRPRPFLSHPEIIPCIKKPTTSAYPSGHSTISRVYARILATMYPERADAFMARADEIAMHRILGGVHHPSDTVAGKKLGDAIARHILDTDEF